jgi:hypothetical protein
MVNQVNCGNVLQAEIGRDYYILNCQNINILFSKNQKMQRIYQRKFREYLDWQDDWHWQDWQDSKFR